MKTITFVRHGQSVANASGISVAHHAISLSGLGELQAIALSKLLPAQPSLIAVDSFGMKSFRRFQMGLPMPNCAVYHFSEAALRH